MTKKGGISMKIKKFIFKPLVFSIVGFFLLGRLSLFPCTVAVASGKATKDGRPLMWKNRDTSSLHNKIVFFSGKKYSFIGLVDVSDKMAWNVWAGINTEGFAIMNAASGDLAGDDRGMRDHGTLMKRALGECATASDFEEFLERTSGKRKVGTSFGVIDALGNACIYETSDSSYKKFDANDPQAAPYGYVIRTNYAFTAPVKGGGGGYIRFERASTLFETAFKEGHLDHKFILQKAARDLANEKLHSHPLSNLKSTESSPPIFINTNDTINRNSTASVAVFHGVSEREKAHLATMWILLGQPVCTVAVPLWANAAGVPPELTGPDTAALNDFSRALVSYLYPDRRGHMSQYLSISRLLSYGGDGVLSRLFKIENEVFARTEKKLKKWEEKKPTQQDLIDFEKKISAWILDSLKKSFPDI
jgi:hypothetical protein